MTMQNPLPRGPEDYTVEWIRTVVNGKKRVADDSSIQWKVAKATKDGENYASVVYALDVDVSSKDSKESHHFIVKHAANFNDIVFQAGFRNAGTYTREDLMYTKIFTEIENFVHHKFQIQRPDAYFSAVEGEGLQQQSTIVLDNLLYDNFTTTPATTLLNEKQCQLILNELAKFHAASFAMKHKGFKFTEKWPILGINGWLLFKEGVKPVIDAPSGYAVNCFKKMPGLNPAYIEKYEAFSKDAYETFFKMHQSIPDEEPFECLLHGDTWTTNVLFKYKGDEIIDFKLIDWQMVRMGSIGLELVYFIFTSTSAEFREKHMDELLEYYHSKFLHYSQLCGVDPIGICQFDLNMVKKLFIRKLPLGLILATTFASVHLTDLPHPDFTTMTSEQWDALRKEELERGGNEKQRETMRGALLDNIKHGLI